MTQFQAIQELYHYECSENNSLVSNNLQGSRIPSQETRKMNRQISVVSNNDMSFEKSPTINEPLSQCDIDAVVKKEHKDLQEALIVYKQLKSFEFVKKFKHKYGDSIRTTEALIYLARNIKYKFHFARSTIYNKGDLSNQKVYLVYSGAVDSWVGKPKVFDAEDDAQVQGHAPETIANYAKKNDVKSLDDLSLFTDKSSFDRQNGRVQQRKDKINNKIRQIASSNSRRISHSSKPNGAIKQLNRPGTSNNNIESAYDDSYQDSSRIEPAPSSLNHLTTNDELLDIENDSREDLSLYGTLNLQTSPRDVRCSTEPDDEVKSQKKNFRIGLSTKSPRANNFDDSLITGLRSANEKHRLTPKLLPDDKDQITTKRGTQTEQTSIDSATLQGIDQNFVLRKINFKKASTTDLDKTTGKKNGKYGYVKETIRKGGHFGEAALKSNQPREESMIAATNCELLVLDVEDYEYLLTRFEKSNTQLLNFLLDYIPGLEDAINMKKIINPESYFHEELYQLHHQITTEGKQGEHIYLLYEGVCQIVKTVKGQEKDQGLKKTYSSTDDVVICIIKPGVFVGEEILFNEESKYEYTVKAATNNVKLLAIRAQTFEECMPKMAYGSLEAIFENKKQKNLEIMNAKIEFARFKPKLPHILSTMVKTEEDLDQMQDLQLNPTPRNSRKSKAIKEEKRYSRVKLPTTIRPYSVEIALPTEHGPQLLDGLKYIRNSVQNKEGVDVYHRQGSDSLEREIRMNTEEKLTEKEKKLRRYMHQGTTKKEEVHQEKPRKVDGKSLKLLDMAVLREMDNRTVDINDIENLRLGSRQQAKRETKTLVMEDPKKKYEGVGARKLTELFAFASPNREKFSGFLPKAKQRNSMFTFTKAPQTIAPTEGPDVKVKVNLKRRRVTYAVGAVKSNQLIKHTASRPPSNIGSIDLDVLSVKMAALSSNDKQSRERLSLDRKNFSARETPEVRSLNLDYENDLSVKKNGKASGRPLRTRNDVTLG